MLEEIVVEDGVRVQLGYSTSEEVGVLIGRVDLLSRKGYILCLVPTPSLTDSPHKNGSNSILPTEEWWIEDHAQQVWDMLPGGLMVVGLYLVSPVVEQNVLIRLKRLTTKLCKPREFLCLSLPSKLLTIHFSTVNARFTCHSLTAPYNTIETETVNVSCQNLDRLHCLESTVHVNISKLIPMCLKDSLHEVKKKIVSGLDSWRSALVIVGNKYCIGDECVTDHLQGASTRCMIHSKSMSLQCGNSNIVDKGTTMTVSGSVNTVAYVNINATLTEASRALTDDIIQTVAIRWVRMYEDVGKMLISDHLEQPQRVKLAVDSWLFNVCTYLFPDEREKDMLERVCEVLGVNVDNVHIIHSEESRSRLKCTKERSPFHLTWRVLIAAIVPIVAACIYFWTTL